MARGSRVWYCYSAVQLSLPTLYATEAIAGIRSSRIVARRLLGWEQWIRMGTMFSVLGLMLLRRK